ncbi:MAG: nucleoside triphosphate pyrophosphohydrolase [Deltaproteobacteria bacterium]|nr:nucleoside triphosphate pyrophosphohydrolase [Deltaproteobacteria bacterium]
MDAFGRLFDVMDALRGPDGCPWDHEQDIASLRSYLLEEVHEVVDAMDHLNDDGSGTSRRLSNHKKELGDLLFQVVFQSQIQMEATRFDVGDVCDAISAKLEFRHPHVFGSEQERSAAPPSWESLKAKERALERSNDAPDDGNEQIQQEEQGALSGIPKNLPTLIRAMRMGERAHQVGFDWPDHQGVLEKINEELGEIEEAFQLDERERKERVGDEIGDLFYAMVNLCRHAQVDPEACLAGTVRKFEQRFRFVEKGLSARGQALEDATLDEMEALWQQAKAPASEE